MSFVMSRNTEAEIQSGKNSYKCGSSCLNSGLQGNLSKDWLNKYTRGYGLFKQDYLELKQNWVGYAAFFAEF